MTVDSPAKADIHQARLLVAAALILLFVSGFAALVYQVLWLRELGLLFGATAQAAATTIAVFFAGIAAGGWFWGRLASRFERPLLVFGLLELGVAATALLHFVLVDAYHALYPAIYAIAGDHLGLNTLFKGMLAFTVLFPPAFLMGGTLPMMGQHLIRQPQDLGRTGSLLYALNTLGGASGAFAAAFVLPLALGFVGAYLLAIGLDLLVGVAAIALVLSLGQLPAPASTQAPTDSSKTAPSASAALAPIKSGFRRGLVWWLAFLSGFLTLAVEVLWTRMFAQVLQNSVYTYAVVLILFLGALAIGASVANRLAARRLNPVAVTAGLLALSGVALATTPFSFHAVTGGLAYMGQDGGFVRYIISVFAHAGAVMLIPAILLGALFPFLLRALERDDVVPGKAIGRLVAANTVGAILGSLVAGFGLLSLIGLWPSILLMAGGYLVLAVVTIGLHPLRHRLAWAVACASLMVPLLVLDTGQLNRLQLAPGERVIELVEGAHATAAATERDGHRLIRVNNFYRLGGTGALDSERNQARIPLLVHPDPESVFFLGLGTGITAGAAGDFPVEVITICELLPEVIQLAERHFNEPARGLFDDERVRIRAEDGRNCLAGSRRQHDVIISDLFTPWRAGTGNLYTVEHYEIVKSRLAENGVFAQWLPLYQLSREEFETIARTINSVFPQVVLWRGDMYPKGPIVALIAYGEETTLPLEAVQANTQAMAAPGTDPDATLAALLRFYIGNIGESGLMEDGPVNTDNRPIIEYGAPRTQRGEDEWFVGMELARFYEALANALPPAQDPYLNGLNEAQRGYVTAGLSYYRYMVLLSEGHEQAAQVFLEDFLERTPFDFAPDPASDDNAPTGWEAGR
ncbi:spermidine synthase [Natronospira proteinivora]|uniref:Spermidine synthase n=1 Tax=Natronospira proteinivora TaxID=1807133 RepID=A0ABT1G8D1_9GAMM|nr:fused MFS/spermidine synthase [Natronospira proteinivora]MCP1727562.1 spermidine synthase [Natronospira proteinivora]